MIKTVWLMATCIAATLAAPSLALAEAPENLLKGCDFGKGATGWDGIGQTDARSIAVVDTDDGGKALRLSRKADGPVRVEQTVKLKPQTLYRLSLTGSGKAKAAVRLRPSSSKDSKFGALLKPWAVATAPLAAGEKPHKTEFIFDSGLKADSAIVMVYLSDDKEAGDYAITDIALTAVSSSKPAADETVMLHLGDSLTITSYLPFEQRCEALIQSMLTKELPGRKVRQVNLAADGEYVKDLLGSERYTKVVKENFERVDIAIIRYGANDQRSGSPADFAKQMSTLCDSLQKDYPGIRIFLSTGTYLKGSKDVNSKYGPYWQATRDLAKERGLVLADVYARFEKEQSDKLTRGPSDMHPSVQGAQLIAEETFAAIKGMLAASASAPATATAPDIKE